MNNLVVKQNQDYFAGADVPVFLGWKCRWFMGRRKGPNLHYLNMLPTMDFSSDIRKGVAAFGSTVTYTAMQLAYSLNVARVVLFGVDHSFASAGPAHTIVKSDGPDRSHFDPNYFGKGMYWGLPDLEGSEKAYGRAKAAFERSGREILDATIGGKLQVFQKITLDDARGLVSEK